MARERLGLDEALRIAGYRDELAALGHAVCQRLREGSLPPDDAKAWTRVLVAAARKVDDTAGTSGEEGNDTT